MAKVYGLEFANLDQQEDYQTKKEERLANELLEKLNAGMAEDEEHAKPKERKCIIKTRTNRKKKWVFKKKSEQQL